MQANNSHNDKVDSTSKILGIISSTITILNLFLALPQLLDLETIKIPYDSLGQLKLYAKIFIIVIVQGSIAYAVAFLFEKSLDKKLLTVFYWFVLSFFAALISIFNIEFFVLNAPLASAKGGLLFAVLFVSVNYLFTYFQLSGEPEETLGIAFLFQYIAFTIVYASFTFKQ